MNKTFEESGYYFSFPENYPVYKADKPEYHDLPAVDFVIETETNILFVEVKNPDNRKAKKESRLKFLRELKNELYQYKARMKYTDTILRKGAIGEHFDKPIVCI